ncbi:restriction endonuclease subunit S [Dethiobacter alkaliphilus]|uniref:restriction endonuclease subunit S n=1 Tax=Dethiobacter alkaliphilus TaxID=427926 RepID=UPI0022275E38|nr:restriction endonuclease subunit S [Dethiobacter alkaliphilus]MCW3491335.1 restriction endonuclease subunit S [Dethiobacter alkaliphilus]
MNKIKLEDIATIVKGKKVEQIEQSSEAIRYIQIEDLRNGDNIKFCEANAKYVTANEEDIIIAWDGANAGTVGFGLSGAIGSTLAKIRINNEILDPRFVGLLLRSKFKYLRNSCTGATIPHINRKSLESVEIPLLPLVVQRKIINIIDTTAEMHAMRTKQLAELENVIISTFYYMFGNPAVNDKGWEVRKLGELLKESPQNGLYKPASEYTNGTLGQPILRIDSFYNGELKQPLNLKRLNCTQREIDTYLLCENDIVINRVNSIEYLGKCALITGLSEDTVFESNMMRLKVFNSIINPAYLTKFLCTPYVYNQILCHAKKAVNQASINQKDVQNFNILIPPLSLQNHFVSILESINEQKKIVGKAIGETQYLFDSLMSEYFD